MPSSGSLSEDGERARDQLAAPRRPRLIARLAALRERERGERGRRSEGDERTEREEARGGDAVAVPPRFACQTACSAS